MDGREYFAEDYLAEKNPNWKGDAVGLKGLHLRVRKQFKQPEQCQDCHKITSHLDLANISQEYKHDVTDWEYLCRKCHMTKDGRFKNLEIRHIEAPKRECTGCKKLVNPSRYAQYCSRECRKLNFPLLTHCKRGHAYSENTYLYPNGARACMGCRKERYASNH